MKYLKYFLFISIIFLAPNVFADEYNMNNLTSASLNGTKNRYRGTEIYNTGTSSTYTFNTRYNGRLSDIETYFDYPFEANTTYRFTYNMATNDFNNNFGTSYWWDCSQSMTNNNANVFSVTYVSYKKIQFSIKPSSNTTCLRVWVRSPNLSTGNITQISNWNLASITLYDPDWQSGSGGGQGSVTPTPVPTSSNQDIINNNNQNTQDIINNNNQNTQDLIENNNTNTDKIVDTLKSCRDSKNLWSYGTSFNGGNDGLWGLSDTSVDIPSGTYTFSGNITGSGSVYVIFNYKYSDNQDHMIQINNSATMTFTSDVKKLALYIPPNVSITNIMLEKGSVASPYEAYGEKICVNKLDETTDAINSTNDYLKDDTDPNVSDNEFLSMFNSVGFTDPLNYLLTLPTQLINKIVSLSDTCSSVNLGTLYGVMLTLPCIDLEDILGSSIWNTIDVIFSVSLLVIIFKNLYDTFSNLLTMGAEKEAKEKFSMPTPMDFLSMILGGDR